MNLTMFLLQSLILSFCLGQFGRLPFFGGDVNIYVWDVIVGVLVFYWIINKLAFDREWELPKLWLPIFTFSITALISLINGSRWLTASEFLVSAGYWLRWVFYACIYFVISDVKCVVSDSCPEPCRRRWFGVEFRISNLLVVSGVILAFLGFVQLAIFPDLSQLDPALGWDPHKNRLVSTWLDPNFLGAYFVLCLSLLTGKLFALIQSKKDLRGSEDGFSRISALATCYLILTTGLLLTFSRSAWGMFAVILGVFGVLKSRKLLFLMVLMFFSAYFFVPRVQTRLAGITDPADSAHFRLISWRRTYEIIKEYPVLGVGYNAFRYAQERAGFFRTSRGVPIESGHAGSGSDSSLLLVWATTGILGLLSYLWLFGSIVVRSFKNIGDNGDEVTPKENPSGLSSLTRRVEELGVFELSLLAALVGLLAESNFINSLFYPPILLWVWIIAGLVVI